MSNLTNYLTDIADAIREKKGTNESIIVNNFPQEIRNLNFDSGGININGDVKNFIVSEDKNVDSGDFIEIDGIKYDISRFNLGGLLESSSLIYINYVVEIGNDSFFVFYSLGSNYYGMVIKVENNELIGYPSTMLQSSLGGKSFLKVDNNHFLITRRKTNGTNDYNIYVDYVTINNDFSLTVSSGQSTVYAGSYGTNSMILINDMPVILHTYGNSTTLSLTEIEINVDTISIGQRIISDIKDVSPHYSIGSVELENNKYMLYYKGSNGNKVCFFYYNIESKNYENSTPISFSTDGTVTYSMEKINESLYHILLEQTVNTKEQISSICFIIDKDNLSLEIKNTILVYSNTIYTRVRKKIKYNYFGLLNYYGKDSSANYCYVFTTYIINNDGSVDIDNNYEIINDVEFYKSSVIMLGENAFALIYQNSGYDKVLCNIYYWVRNSLIQYEEKIPIGNTTYSSSLFISENICGDDYILVMLSKTLFAYKFNFYGTKIKKYESRIDGVSMESGLASEEVKAVIAN